MARQARNSSRGRAKSSVRVDMSNISKAFEPKQEYAIRITEASLEEGQKAPYFNLKIQGIEGGDYENSVMYHRASTGEASLWRLRPLLEAFGFEIPDGPLDLDASDFVGRTAMCSTYLDRYDGGSSVKPDEFWELEDSGVAGGDGSKDFDLDDLDDDEIDALAEAVGATGRNTNAKKKALAKMDIEDLAEAFADLADKEGDDGDDGEDSKEFDIDSLDDDELKSLGEALGVTAKTTKRIKMAIEKMDQEEVAEAWAELNEEKEEQKASGKKGAVTEDDIQEMNEDELEALVEEHELDLDLSEFKTLRKMKNAVIDAMEEGGHFDS